MSAEAATRVDAFTTRATLAWAGLAAVFCTAALLSPSIPRNAIDWQPSLAASEPWRAFTAVAVHYSGLHLAANLAGGALVAALGLAARVPARCVIAWLAAWPLTQLGLVLQPQLTHYGGLSGVWHAAVAIVAVHLIVADHGLRRVIGMALFVGLVIKVMGESPWGEPLRHPAGWDIAVAPLAHATGLAAGTCCSLLAALLGPREPRYPPR